jgi:hypothetical protein
MDRWVCPKVLDRALTGLVPGVLLVLVLPSQAQSHPPAATVAAPAPTTTLADGVPLRVQLDRRYPMRVGQSVQGRLMDPVYSVDHIVLPTDTPIYGTIQALGPAPKSERFWAKMNGDFTPLRKPVLQFTSIQLPDGTRVPIQATATERTAKLVKMGGTQKRPSYFARAKQALHDKIAAAKKELVGIFHPHGNSDHARQALYGQIPYHPQDIWSGSQFDAVLARPLTLTDPGAGHLLPVLPFHANIPPGIIESRLITPLSSANSKVGTPAEAVLTQPYMTADKTHVILPEGTRLLGAVTQARPARKLGRNGVLRFTFRQVVLPSGAQETVHARMRAVEGQKGQNITVDQEGGAHANASQGKYLAPLALGAMAGDVSIDPPAGQGTGTLASNGFGLVSRLLAVVYMNPAAIQGFAYYALGQSVTKRWLVRGHDVVFPRNTRMEMNVSER